MRGLPGSGKSTIAEIIAGGNCSAMFDKDGFRYKKADNGFIVSTDYYFEDSWPLIGNYNFKEEVINTHHKKARDLIERFMIEEKTPIIFDNTNTRFEYFSNVISNAEKYGYKTVIIEVPHISVNECFNNNSHGVSLETLEKMEKKWSFGRIKGTNGEFKKC